VVPREAIRPQKALEASKVLQVLCARRAHKEGAVGSRRGKAEAKRRFEFSVVVRGITRNDVGVHVDDVDRTAISIHVSK
jgi:hypothetical protein